MKQRPFRLTRMAKASLISIGRYTEARWGKVKRREYMSALDGQFHALAANPEKGRAQHDLMPGLRSYPEGSHIIYYFQQEKQLAIVDVLHRRMDPLEWLSKE